MIPFLGERCELVCGVLGVDGGVDLAQVGGERFAVLVGHEAHAGADLMHQAGLDGRVREGRLDRLREAGQPVDADEQDVGDAAGLQIAENVKPELRALRLLEPQTEHVTLAVEVDAQRHVARLVSHRMPVADLHDQRVEVNDRVDALQRPVLPRLRVAEHRVGDLRDQIRRDLGAVDLREVSLDLADRQTAGVQADHAIVEPDPPGLTLPDDLRLKRALAIPRGADPQRSLIGQDRL